MGDRRCCCPHCIVFQSAFDREDSTDLGSNWEEDSGKWEIVDEELWCEEEGVVMCQLPTPTNAQYAKIDIIDPVDGQIVRLLMASNIEGTSFHAAEVEFWDNGALGLYCTLRLKRGGSILLASADLHVPLLSPFYIESWIDEGYPDQDTNGWFCMTAGGVGAACPSLKTTPDGALDGPYNGLFATDDTLLDDYILEDHYVNNPDCRDCACQCEQDGVITRLPNPLTLTVTGTLACGDAAGEVKLVFEDNECYGKYVSDPDTATGCLTSLDWEFELSCDWDCETGSGCTGASLWVDSPANCGCGPLDTECQLTAMPASTCSPISLVFQRGANGGPGGCPCCGLGPIDPTGFFGTLFFTVTE